MNSSRIKLKLFAGLVLAILVFQPTVQAEELHPLLTDKHQLWLGVYFPEMDSKFTIGGSADMEDLEFDFEGQFSARDDDEIFAGSYFWQFGEKWSFQTQYFDSSRGGSALLTEDVQWGDYVLHEGSNAAAGLDLTILRIVFARELFRGDHYVFGAGIGVHWAELEVFAEGEFFLNGESTGFRREAVGAEAPLPNITGFYLYSISPKWAFAAKVDWLELSIDEYSGGLINASVGMNYQLFDNVGIGLNYQYFVLDGDVDKQSWRGGMEIDFHGPLLYASFNW